MKPIFLVTLALLGALFVASCKSDTIVDRESAKMAQVIETGPTERCAVCQRDFPEGSLKDRDGKRLCGTCIDAQSGG